MLSPIPDGGYQNKTTAEGENALGSLTDLQNQAQNTAIGFSTLGASTSGTGNTAIGAEALLNIIDGSHNTAVGVEVLRGQEHGAYNTAIGAQSLYTHQSGNENTVIGFAAMSESLTGENNIALGAHSGQEYATNESNNINIGNRGVIGDSNTIRIGTDSIHTKTFIAGSGLVSGMILFLIKDTPSPDGFIKLGSSSTMYKDLNNHGHILDMDIYQKD